MQSVKTAEGFPSENDTVSSSILIFLFCNLTEESSHFFVVFFFGNTNEYCFILYYSKVSCKSKTQVKCLFT